MRNLSYFAQSAYSLDKLHKVEAFPAGMELQHAMEVLWYPDRLLVFCDGTFAARKASKSPFGAPFMPVEPFSYETHIIILFLALSVSTWHDRNRQKFKVARPKFSPSGAPYLPNEIAFGGLPAPNQ